MKASGAIVVSIPKAGTHVLSRLMGLLGYTIRGVGGKPWDVDEISSGGVWAEELGLLPDLCNDNGYYWAQFSRNREQQGREASPCPWTDGRCLVIHELYLNKIDGELYRSWLETGEPKIIFNYRDPRACLTSYVHWLRDGKYMAPNPVQLAYRRILNQFGEFGDALQYAIDDPSFPGKRQFDSSRWLLHHPDVLNTRYEDLLGLDSAEHVDRVTGFLGTEPLLPHPTLRDKNSPTFREGLFGAWRDEWTADHYAAFDVGVLRDYGYNE
jgi:hypothetical protein